MSRSRSPDDRGRGGGGGGGGGKGGGRFGRNENAKIYIGNLPNSMDENELRSHFDKFGPLSDVFMPKDPSSGQSRGFGFVTYADEGAARDCARTAKHVILDKVVDVKHATPTPPK